MRKRGSQRTQRFHEGHKGFNSLLLLLNKFRKISWYETQAFHRRIFLAFNPIFLLWSIYGFVQRIKNKRKDRTHIISLFTSVVGFLIPIYLIIEVANAPEQLFDYGVPFFIKMIPIMIMLVAIGIFLTLVFFIRDYKKIKSGKLYEILFILFCIGTLMSLFWYDHFNLLGFQY
jgi:formate hydrogenlyase subunit 3/multisubunit Na+/H+ antiporter MnhD subunit